MVEEEIVHIGKGGGLSSRKERKKKRPHRQRQMMVSDLDQKSRKDRFKITPATGIRGSS